MASISSMDSSAGNLHTHSATPSRVAQQNDMHSGRRRSNPGVACERCRAHKLKCNRELPCTRCEKFGGTCVYRNTSARAERKNHAPRPLLQKTTHARAVNEPIHQRPSLLKHRLGGTSYHRAKSRGFRGNTAGLSVLHEVRAELPSSGWNEDELAEDERHTAVTEADKDIRALAASILAVLPSKTVSEESMECFKHLGFCSNKLESCGDYFHDSFWSLFEKDLQTSAGRASVAEILIANTRKPLRIPKTNAEWLSSIAGKNSRFEMIGYFILNYANITYDLPSTDPIVKMLVPPDQTVEQYYVAMLDAADACLELCISLDPAANILSLLLWNRTLHFQSVIYGDSSHDLWRGTGTMVNAATAIGMHRSIETTDIAPLYYQAWSKIAYNVYEFDKILATFTGRPPIMSRRYMAIEPPLDIPDNIVAATNSVAEFRNFVDEKGFNLTGAIGSSTSARINALESILRDEVLEFALCKPSSDIGATIAHLRERCDSYWNSISTFFHRPANKETFASLRRNEVSLLAHCRLSYLHNLFLIERISKQHGDAELLLRAAFEIVEIVIAFFNERDRLPSIDDTCHWFISFHGIPAASALAIELLKSKGSSSSNRLPAQRSQITQMLTLFISLLDWIRPTDGNYVLCGQVKTLIQRILDDVLASLFDGQSQAPSFDLSRFDVSSIPIFGADYDSWFDTDVNLGWPDGFFQ